MSSLAALLQAPSIPDHIHQVQETVVIDTRLSPGESSGASPVYQRVPTWNIRRGADPLACLSRVCTGNIGHHSTCHSGQPQTRERAQVIWWTPPDRRRICRPVRRLSQRTGVVIGRCPFLYGRSLRISGNQLYHVFRCSTMHLTHIRASDRSLDVLLPCLQLRPLTKVAESRLMTEYIVSNWKNVSAALPLMAQSLTTFTINVINPLWYRPHELD